MMKTLRIGHIGKGFGLKGELKVRSFSADPADRFNPGQTLLWQREDQERWITIDTVREHQGFYLIKFVGYEDLSAAEALFGADLFIDAATLGPGIYVHQLKECVVVDEGGNMLGPVIDVLDYSQLILRVKTAQREVLIPYVEAFIIKTDVASKTITVRWMEGL
jgi:16S rRNA processing protein RimM